MRPPRDDPYWDAFINRPPADPNNLITHAFKQVQPGGVNPVRTEVHSPNVMSGHVKDLARFYGADRVGIVGLASGMFAIVCALRADYDTSTHLGVGGQTPAMKGLFASYTLGAYIRELGYTTETAKRDAKELVRAAGMNVHGMHIADVIVTDLPLQPDGTL
jgi:hypothetical protein